MAAGVATDPAARRGQRRRRVLLLDVHTDAGQVQTALAHLGGRGERLDACVLVEVTGQTPGAFPRARGRSLRSALSAVVPCPDVRELGLDDVDRLLAGHAGPDDEPPWDELVVLQHSLVARLVLRRLLAATLNRSTAAPRPVPALSMI